MKKIAVLPGDGIGPEIMAEAVKGLNALDLPLQLDWADVGGKAYETSGHPLPPATLELAQEADAVLFGAVGDWKYDKLDRPLRPVPRYASPADHIEVDKARQVLDLLIDAMPVEKLVAASAPSSWRTFSSNTATVGLVLRP